MPAPCKDVRKQLVFELQALPFAFFFFFFFFTEVGRILTAQITEKNNLKGHTHFAQNPNTACLKKKAGGGGGH